MEHDRERPFHAKPFKRQTNIMLNVPDEQTTNSAAKARILCTQAVDLTSIMCTVAYRISLCIICVFVCVCLTQL